MQFFPVLMAIIIRPHALERMVERGITEEEIHDAIDTGSVRPAKHGRICYSKTFPCRFVLRGKKTGIKTVQISEEVNIDLSPNGKVYGIELLNAREQLIKGKTISFVDESTEKIRNLPLVS